jgi:thiamine-monophosphate kinase
VQRPIAGQFSTPASEDAVVARIAAALAATSGRAPAGEVWIGDDAAVVGAPGGPLVLATDACVAGVHADLALVGVDDLGWKALTATISDIAAVGARPCHSVVAVCAPRGTDVDRLMAGVGAAAARWRCPVVGGDVTTAGQVVVSVTATGVLEGPQPPVLRSGASAGDCLVVTGPLGGSAAGLRVLRGGGPSGEHDAALVASHRRPLARLAEGAAAREAGATAMMDVSDGLALDAHRLATASDVGFALDAIPVAPGATEEEALGGGEDYELLIAVDDPERLAAAFAASGLRPPVLLGRCTRDPTERTFRGRPLAPAGYQHALE